MMKMRQTRPDPIFSLMSLILILGLIMMTSCVSQKYGYSLSNEVSVLDGKLTIIIKHVGGVASYNYIDSSKHPVATGDRTTGTSYLAMVWSEKELVKLNTTNSPNIQGLHRVSRAFDASIYSMSSGMMVSKPWVSRPKLSFYRDNNLVMKLQCNVDRVLESPLCFWPTQDRRYFFHEKSIYSIKNLQPLVKLDSISFDNFLEQAKSPHRTATGYPKIGSIRVSNDLKKIVVFQNYVSGGLLAYMYDVESKKISKISMPSDDETRDGDIIVLDFVIDNGLYTFLYLDYSKGDHYFLYTLGEGKKQISFNEDMDSSLSSQPWWDVSNQRFISAGNPDLDGSIKIMVLDYGKNTLMEKKLKGSKSIGSE